MGESSIVLSLASEPGLVEAAGEIARCWRRDGRTPLIVGLRGELGSGKTSWVRAMLRGLGHSGRVPSPTYTLLEEYPFAELVLVHLDLYRLASGAELENFGVRDWFDRPDLWLLAEWPERAGRLLAHCDLTVNFEITGESSRRVAISAASDAGLAALASISDIDSRFPS